MQQKFLIDIKLSKTLTIKVEGYYSPAFAGVFYHKDGSGEPPEPAQFEIINVYDMKLRNITEYFECFDGFLSEQKNHIIKKTKYKYVVESSDIWQWLEDLVMEQHKFKEDEIDEQY